MATSRTFQISGKTIGLVAGSLATLGVSIVAAVAAVLAQFVITPRPRKRDDVQVLRVESRGEATDVILRENMLTRASGMYGIAQQGGEVYARLSEPIGQISGGEVRRRLVKLDSGTSLGPGPARWHGAYFQGDPGHSLGLDFEHVFVKGQLGQMPAWFVPAAFDAQPEGDTAWAILIHGYGATRDECLRALPTLSALGIPALVISYRNDVGAPRSSDGRCHLGSTEWQDADSAIAYALSHGASRVIVFGWSMGGGIALRVSVKGEYADKITALVLNGPAVDWPQILLYHAKQYRAPIVSRHLALELLRSAPGAMTSRLGTPIALDEMTADYYAENLSKPTLLIHSLDDEFVPPNPSRDLARARPDLVEFVPFKGAMHVREWNTSRRRWERSVEEFLRRHIDLRPEAFQRRR